MPSYGPLATFCGFSKTPHVPLDVPNTCFFLPLKPKMVILGVKKFRAKNQPKPKRAVSADGGPLARLKHYECLWLETSLQQPEFRGIPTLLTRLFWRSSRQSAKNERIHTFIPPIAQYRTPQWIVLLYHFASRWPVSEEIDAPFWSKITAWPGPNRVV